MTSVLSTAEVARILQADVRQVHRWARDGRLPHVSKAPGLRGAYTFDPAVVERVMRGEHPPHP